MARPAIAQRYLDRPLERTFRIDALQTSLPLILRPATPFTDDELYDFCRANHALRIERSAGGDVIIMPPTGAQTGRRNSLLVARFAAWAERDATGVTFDSSTGFILPNGAGRSPDLAWVTRERWDALSEDEQEKFAPLCPDVAIELRSRSDSLPALQDKCAEYVANGARLVWLIDPVAGRVHVYRNESITVLERPTELFGDPELEGLSLRLDEIL